MTRQRGKGRALGILVLGAWLLACASPSTGTGDGTQSSRRTEQGSLPKTLTMSITEDPRNFWDGINGGGGSGTRELGHLVNQYLAAVLPDGSVEPRLLARLPSVDNGDWVLHPDGSMEVTYRLRPGVRWHDSVPFTTDDLVLSWQVGRDPAIPNGNQGANRLITDMVAIDPETAIATWSQTYPFADRLEHRELFPLPAHILQQAYSQSPATVLTQPYFTDEYVGTGPFKLNHWEHGNELALVANEDYFLGRPKLDGIRVLFIADPNTMLAGLAAGNLNLFLPPGGPNWEAYQPLRQEWTRAKSGQMLTETPRWIMVEIQKSRQAQPADLADARVRRALLLAMNREELARTLLGDLGMVADSWVTPQLSYYRDVESEIIRYPYDPRQATTLLNEAGWVAGTVGRLQKAGTPFQFTLTYTSPDAQAGAAILQQDWKAVGVETSVVQLTPFQLRDAQERASFTGGDITENPLGGVSAARRFEGVQTPTAANRYAGTNRGSFADADWDAVSAELRVSLDERQRLPLEARLLRIFTSELPSLPLYFGVQVIPMRGFTGLDPVTGAAHTGNVMHTTNAHQWMLAP